MKIGNIVTPNNVFLAPMAGITDLPFRIIAKRLGAGMTYSEMVSAKGLFYKNENTNALLSTRGEPGLIGVQIFGSEPDVIADTVKRLNETAFCLIDINMGCPAPKIVKNGEGSALMKDLPLMGEIIYAAARASEKPVTVKIRSGFNSSCINAVEAAKTAEQSGAAAITVHGRTREQYYSGTADWNVIAEVKAAVSIPVIANGDIKSGSDAIACLNLTKADGVMLGRAAYGDPWVLRECVCALGGEAIPEKLTLAQKAETAKEHFMMLVEEKGGHIAVREFRRHLSSYIKGFDGASRLREKVVSCETVEETEKIIETIKNLGNVKI